MDSSDEDDFIGPDDIIDESNQEDVETKDDDHASTATFRDLGVVEPLCEAIEKLGWKMPTPIQANALPEALSGRDLIGLAETGA